VLGIDNAILFGGIAVLVIGHISISKGIIKTDGTATIRGIIPLFIRPVSAILHLVHYQLVVGNKTFGLMSECVIHCRVFSTPALSAQCTTFAVLAEKALTVKMWEK
jgi:hypothetical protein